MKITKKGTVVQFSCGSCGSEFVAGINVVETSDKGENYYANCPVCGAECHADCMDVKNRDQKNAEVSGIEDIVKEAISNIYDKPETKELLPNTIPITAPDIHFEHMIDWRQSDPSYSGIPESCRTCSNHPSNGGSGICHCIMGITPLKC